MLHEWIATKERLPGEMISVLIYDAIREMISIGYRTRHQWWYGDHYGRWDALVMEGIITHWMPLPDPPDIVEMVQEEPKENS